MRSWPDRFSGPSILPAPSPLHPRTYPPTQSTLPVHVPAQETRVRRVNSPPAEKYTYEEEERDVSHKEGVGVQ